MRISDLSSDVCSSDLPPAALLGERVEADGDDREGKAQQEGIDRDDAEIAAPAGEARDFPPPARQGGFRHHQGGQRAEEKGQPEGRLVGQQEVSHGARCSCRRGWRLARAALRADMRCLNSTSAARGHPNPLHPGGPSLYPSGRKQTPGSEMARPRTIDRDAVLDAAQRVVARDGAAGLTLEAVAAEDGISKAGSEEQTSES